MKACSRFVAVVCDCTQWRSASKSFVSYGLACSFGSRWRRLNVSPVSVMVTLLRYDRSTAVSRCVRSRSFSAARQMSVSSTVSRVTGRPTRWQYSATWVSALRYFETSLWRVCRRWNRSAPPFSNASRAVSLTTAATVAQVVSLTNLGVYPTTRCSTYSRSCRVSDMG